MSTSTSTSYNAPGFYVVHYLPTDDSQVGESGWSDAQDSGTAKEEAYGGTIERPQIFLLCFSFQSFLDQQYASLIDGISRSPQLKRAKSAAGAIRYLDSNTPKAIISYLQNGGAVIFGLHFPNFVTHTFESFFEESFGLTWKRGNYQRGIFQVNTFYTLPRGVVASSLASAYSMKGLHVRGTKSQEKLFVPILRGKTQSMVFAPADVSQSQAAFVGTRIGNGFLPYVGDVSGSGDA
ncbi:hypothetical protein DL98DRAFT_658815 [Cadophora sp. DSE1049]|nr:hypothetical protein DL98DRAFT_658815 [Cadophora sp. DSE1049]